MDICWNLTFNRAPAPNYCAPNNQQLDNFKEPVFFEIFVSGSRCLLRTLGPLSSKFLLCFISKPESDDLLH